MVKVSLIGGVVKAHASTVVCAEKKKICDYLTVINSPENAKSTFLFCTGTKEEIE